MDFSGYVGLPYVEGGRDRSGLDCWGLLRLFYREQLGILLPSYDGRYRIDSDAMGLEADAWREVGPIADGDALLFRFRDGHHVGIAAPGGRVLHVESSALSRIDRRDDPYLKRRFLGAYRR